MWIHQTSQKCSSSDSDDVLILFRAIGLWFTETFSTFPKTTSYYKEEAIPARHVPVWALKKCYCFSERNPIWPPLPVICCDISDLSLRVSAYELAKLSIKKYSSKGFEEVLLLVTMGSDRLENFEFFHESFFIWIRHTCQKCSPGYSILMNNFCFGATRNAKGPAWSLISWGTFGFIRRTTAYEFIWPTRRVLKKCC